MNSQWLTKYDIKRFCRFVVTGGTATLIDFVIYMLLRTYIGSGWGKFTSMLGANVFSFVTNKRWTFSVKEKANIWMVVRYVIVQGVNIGVNVGINQLSLKLTNMVILSFVIATGCATIINYLGQKLFVYKR